MRATDAIVIALALAQGGCCCYLAGGAAVAAVAAAPSPTPTPPSAPHDPSFFTPIAAGVDAEPLPSGTGAAIILGRSATLQSPIVLRFRSGATAKGILDAVSGELVQLRQSEGTVLFRIEDVTDYTQF